MKLPTILICLFLFSFNCFSQNVIEQSTVSAEFGRNMHGTGDISGFNFGLRFNKYLNKRFDLITAFEANLNDSAATPFIWEDPNGNVYDSTLHDVLAGFQLNIGLGFNIINSNKHKFGINPSVYGRYQANSVLGDRIIDYPILTGYPVPIRYLIRNEPGRTYAIGGSIRLYYNYRINSKYFVGVNPGFQNDSRGDTMLFITLSFGISL